MFTRIECARRTYLNASPEKFGCTRTHVQNNIDNRRKANSSALSAVFANKKDCQKAV